MLPSNRILAVVAAAAMLSLSVISGVPRMAAIAAAADLPTTDIVGTWNWVDGQTLVIHSDGSFDVYRGNNKINEGRWIIVDASGPRYRFTHRGGGWVDTVTLSGDGRALDGTNNLGSRLRGTKRDARQYGSDTPAVPDLGSMDNPVDALGSGQWQFVGTGDCGGHDIIGRGTRAPTPAPSMCATTTGARTAVCWSDGCTYKTIEASDCTGGGRPGDMYRCAITEVIAQPALPPEGEVTIFYNGNPGAVISGVRGATRVTLDNPCRISEVVTYHWNDARGAPPGRIRITDSGGRELGSWAATGRAGQGGVPDAYWVVQPGIILPSGVYFVSDTGPATWAQNRASGGAGFVTVRGSCDLRQASPESATVRGTPATPPQPSAATTSGEIARARIGPEGGAVVVPGEISIEFPAGALARAEQVVIQRQYADADGALYAVTRDGGDAPLAVPARIVYTLRPTVDATNLLVLQQVGKWMTVYPGSVNPATGKLEVQVDHFSDNGYVNRQGTVARLAWGTHLTRKYSLIVAVGTYLTVPNLWARVGASLVVNVAARVYGWFEAPAEATQDLVEDMEGPVSGGGITIYWDDATAIDSDGLAAYYDEQGRFLRFAEQGPRGPDRPVEVQGSLGRVAERRYVPNAALFALADLQYCRRWQAAADLPDRPETVVRIHTDLGRDDKGIPYKAEWDGLTLSIHRDMINKAYGREPNATALDEMRALLAHEYWHASREIAKEGLQQLIESDPWPAEREEAIGVALESLQVPGSPGFLQRLPWREAGQLLAEGIDAPSNSILQKSTGALWPFAKFLFHREGGGKALMSLADGTLSDSLYNDRFRRFALSLLTSDEPYHLDASEKVTLSSGEPYTSSTGWGELQLHQLVNVQALEHQLPPGQLDFRLPPDARSLRVVGFLTPSRDPGLPGGPFIVRRLVAREAGRESIWTFPPVDRMKNWQPAKSSVLKVSDQRGVVLPKTTLDTGIEVTVPVALLGLRPGASDDSALLAYRLLPPTLLGAELAPDPAAGGPEALRIRWQAPSLGKNLRAATALAGYQVLGRQPGETLARVLAELRYEDFRELPEEAWAERPAIADGAIAVEIAADATEAFLPAGLLAAYSEIGLRSIDGAMRDKASTPLASEPHWLAGDTGQIVVFVGKTYDELGRPTGPFAGSEPFPDAEVTWSWKLEGRSMSGQGRTDASGRLTITGVPLNVDVSLSARGEKRLSRCTPQDPSVRVTFGWDGQPITNVK